MKIEHVFLHLYGTHYKDYTLYTNRAASRYSEEKYPIVVDSEYKRMLSSDFSEMFRDEHFVPNIGDEIHLVPDSCYAVQDVRNNYKLKREFDSGVCNVFSPIPTRGKRASIVYHHFYIDETNKIIVCYWDPHGKDQKRDYATTLAELKTICPESIDGRFYFNITLCLSYLAISPAYYRFLTGQYTKPCIYYDCLPMQRNELTCEQLCLLYESSNDDSPEGKKNYLIQLSALAQSNWKEYPSTMYELFNNILRWKAVHRDIRNKVRSQPKQVREMLQYKITTEHFCNPKDYNMMATFLENYLHVGDCRYATMRQVSDKLQKYDLSQALFEKFYGTMVRIKPKAYEG